MTPTRLFNKNFTLVVLGQIISLFGNAILRFALPLYLLRKTGSPTLFGIVTACSLIPMIFLSFAGGILADRVNKRNIMVVLDFLTAIIITILLLLLGKAPLVPLLIISLMMLYGISGTYQPTVQASIPALTPQGKILSASAVINQIGALSSLLGPILGGLLFGAFGITPILIVSIICFLSSAIMEIFIKIPFSKRENNTNSVFKIINSDVKESFSFIKYKKPIFLKIILFIAFFNMVLAAIMIVGLPVLIVNTLKMSDASLGLCQGIMAVGGLIGGILTSVFSKKIKMSHSFIMLLIASLLVGGISVPFILNLPAQISYLIITALGFFAIMLSTSFSILVLATIQTQTPAALVGKVLALLMAVSVSAQPLGQAIYGVLFEILPPGIILLSASILSVFVTLFTKKTFALCDNDKEQ